MNSKTTVIIADDSVEFLSLLAGQLEEDPRVQVIGRAGNGEELVALVQQLHPDVIVTDTVLAKLDGLAALRQIAALPEKCPLFIVTPSFTSPQILAEASALGAQHFMPKPFDISVLLQRICQPAPQSTPQPANTDVTLLVTEAMHQLGVPAHILGHRYLREAIVMAIQNTDVIHAVTKELYPTVAKRHSTTGSRVERAIRHAIESAWGRGDLNAVQEYFGATISGSRGKPTNSEFISMVADHLRLKIHQAG